MLKLAQIFDNRKMYEISDFMDRVASTSYSVMKNIADQVKNMHPYDFNTHFDLIDAVDPKQLSDPYDLKNITHGKPGLTKNDVQNILDSADNFELYEDLYGMAVVYPNSTTGTWFYRFKNPSSLTGLTNEFQIHNTEIPITSNIDVAVQKIHKLHPETFIDPYAHEDENYDLDSMDFNEFDDQDYDLKDLGNF